MKSKVTGEVTVVTDEAIGEEDPLLARLLAAATIVLDPDALPVAKGNLCAQHAGFNVHAATRVAAHDEQGRLALCKYILRPPLANERLTIIDDDHLRLAFKKPWSNGATSVTLSPARSCRPWVCPRKRPSRGPRALHHRNPERRPVEKAETC